MNQDLEKLKEIVQGSDWDADAREAIANLEADFEKAVADEKLLTIPSVADYVEYVELEIKRLKELLSEKTMQMTDRERIQAYERKEAFKAFLVYFKPVNTVEKTIKQHLDVAEGKATIQDAA